MSGDGTVANPLSMICGEVVGTICTFVFVVQMEFLPWKMLEDESFAVVWLTGSTSGVWRVLEDVLSIGVVSVLTKSTFGFVRLIWIRGSSGETCFILVSALPLSKNQALLHTLYGNNWQNCRTLSRLPWIVCGIYCKIFCRFLWGRISCRSTCLQMFWDIFSHSSRRSW